MISETMEQISKSVLLAYDKIADKYVEAYSENDLTDYKYLDDFIALLGEGKVLDMGCGCGESASYLARYGFDVTGVDFSSNMLAEAHKLYPNLKFDKQDILNTSYESKSFDGITLTYVVNHFNQEGLILLKKEIDRLLKDDGIIFISFHVGNEEKNVTDPLDDSVKIYYNFLNIDELETIFCNYKRKKFFSRKSFGEEEFLCDKAFVVFGRNSQE